MSLTVALVDYGMGNIHSVYRKLKQQGATIKLTNNGEDILKADKIVLPGVGNFSRAILNLKESGAISALNEAVLNKKKPILGICLGAQLMSKFSEEGNSQGLDWINARVRRFSISNPLLYKVPQSGWNTISIAKQSPLLKGINNGDEFYFLHSFHFILQNTEDALTRTTFEYEYVSAFEKENIFGVQFHPEKSHNAGITLLKNFLAL